ncbi:type I secretion system permease/ATPase [Bradyrhizobium sp. CCBAU 11361]|uniref:type I secretion system permease/ATPase n=1 Tax=Bradyrhizobium sp. CCBAU 11361 TaxID=1630812 RepID=UPI002306883E|nr:type I secretion system permease/ATPase [Bradyrhizobium sp. CCBAU 11361]MDA9495033.1 peptidase C39 [Bradyrhizobium sp. CCBAU 11361]
MSDSASLAEAADFSKPVIDTGIVALAILAAVHEKPIDVEQTRREHVEPGAFADRDDLLRAAKAEGFKARYITTDFARLARSPLPAIAEAVDGGFFILARVDPDGVLVQEIGKPTARWTEAELASRWRGGLIVVTLREAAGGGFARFGMTWFLPVIVRFRRVFGEVLLVSLFMQIAALATPLFFQVIIDKVLVHKGVSTLTVVMMALAGLAVLEITLSGVRTYLFAHTTSRIDAILGAKLFRHLVGLPIAYFESRPVGQTVARVRELENIRQFLTSSGLMLIIDIVFTVVFFAVMALIAPMLTLIPLAAIPFYILVSIVVTPILKARIQERFARGAQNQSLLVEMLTGMETVKAMAIETQARRRWERQLAGYITASFRTVSLGTVGSQSVALINRLSMALILWLGASAVMDGSLTIGQLVAFNMLAGQVSQPIVRLAQMWQDFQQFRISIERLGDIIDTPAETVRASVRHDLPPLRGDIRFEHVVFRYRPATPPALEDVSLKVSPGEVIGVVGRSGSGKSTLMKLVQRFHIPEAGKVLVDGVDVALIDPAWLRRQIGVVLQENVLFNRTVRENIALANPAMSLERVIQVAKLAGAHDFILELPHAYDTVLEERGANLSGGQRQRVAIARALATDPRVLVFDEATSALDYESERIIQANMRAMCRGRTVLIVVMDRGRCVEQGTHEELLRQGGFYAGLVRQSASDRGDEQGGQAA